MKPKVSIIIPNYNHAKFLQQRLDSVFNQTYQNFEVILLDDASTDESVQVLDAYKSHPKVSHFVINKENSGSPFKQWQKGIELAKGEYIWIAESDDYCELDFLEVCVSVIKKNKNIGMLASPLLIVDDKGETKQINELKSGVHIGTEIISNYLVKGNIFYNASSVVFKKSALESTFLSKINQFRICGDWWLWINILKTHDLYYHNKFMSYYRKHVGASTNKLWENPIFYREVRLLLINIKHSSNISIKLLEKSILYWIERIENNQLSKNSKLALSIKFWLLLSIKMQLRFVKRCVSKYIN